MKESNRKEVKLKEVVRLGGLYSIFKKGKGVWRKVSRKYMGKLMGDKCYFHKVCLCRLISVPILHLWWQESFSSSWFGRGGHGLRENSCPAFREKRGGKISSCICWFSIAFSSKTYLCQSGNFWGGISSWSPSLIFQLFQVRGEDCFIQRQEGWLLFCLLEDLLNVY